jgi:hypothetical protein
MIIIKVFVLVIIGIVGIFVAIATTAISTAAVG